VEQGVFYTFLSLVTAHYFFDLGVGFMLGNLAGRRVADAELHNQKDTVLALGGILRFACIWSAIAGVVMFVVIGSVGFVIFARNGFDIPSLSTIWLAYCGCSCVLMIINIYLRILDGLGHVQVAAYLRLFVSSLNVFLIYVLVLGGLGLAALPVALCFTLFLAVVVAYRTVPEVRLTFSAAIWQVPSDLNWRRDIWPFQRGVAVTWLSAYVFFQAPIPILFWLQGAEAAGRFGMCVQIFLAINSSANIFLTYKVRPWTQLAVSQAFDALKKDFWRVCILTAGLTLLGAIAVLLGFFLLEKLGSDIPSRASAPTVMIFYACAIVLNQFYFAVSYYFRAQERERVWKITLVAAICTLVTPLLAPAAFDEVRAGLAFLLISVVVVFGGTLLLAKREGIIAPDSASIR
jgi:O-antigen/teichoic acid export membrane protein